MRRVDGWRPGVRISERKREEGTFASLERAPGTVLPHLLLRSQQDERNVLMATKEGWQGRFFEDFEVGDVYQHPLGRTVTTTDNIWFTLLTQNTAPIHFDHHYAAQTEFGKPLVDSTFTLALVTGQSVADISQNVFANLGWDAVRLPNPPFEAHTHNPHTPALYTPYS